MIENTFTAQRKAWKAKGCPEDLTDPYWASCMEQHEAEKAWMAEPVRPGRLADWFRP